MTTKPLLTPSRAARRKLLVERYAEKLEEWGSPFPEARATQLLATMDELGFTLPPALDDPPPAPCPSTPEGRAAARALFEQARAARATGTA